MKKWRYCPPRTVGAAPELLPHTPLTTSAADDCSPAAEVPASSPRSRDPLRVFVPAPALPEEPSSLPAFSATVREAMWLHHVLGKRAFGPSTPLDELRLGPDVPLTQVTEQLLPYPTLPRRAVYEREEVALGAIGLPEDCFGEAFHVTMQQAYTRVTLGRALSRPSAALSLDGVTVAVPPVLQGRLDWIVLARQNIRSSITRQREMPPAEPSDDDALNTKAVMDEGWAARQEELSLVASEIRRVVEAYRAARVRREQESREEVESIARQAQTWGTDLERLLQYVVPAPQLVEGGNSNNLVKRKKKKEDRKRLRSAPGSHFLQN